IAQTPLACPRHVCSGQAAQVTCCGSSSSYYAWSLLKPGCTPVAERYGNSKRPVGLPTRFCSCWSGSRGMLTITGVRAVDEREY
uniref:Uncharacterized protein n=1 Tax=Dromaius novaehollandiae TaxID=8790 RepID=A0A8C4JLF5_DRONO